MSKNRAVSQTDFPSCKQSEHPAFYTQYNSEYKRAADIKAAGEVFSYREEKYVKT